MRFFFSRIWSFYDTCIVVVAFFMMFAGAQACGYAVKICATDFRTNQLKNFTSTLEIEKENSHGGSESKKI